MSFRNNVTRLLDARKIPYELFEFSKDKHSAEDTAALLGVPESHVYKTLVVLREPGELSHRGGKVRGKKPLLVMAPAGRELNVKTLAASLGEKTLRMASQTEAEALTKLQVGGISALAVLNRGFDIYIERTAESLPFIHISAGERGANVRLQVADLIQVTGAKLGDTVLHD